MFLVIVLISLPLVCVSLIYSIIIPHSYPCVRGFHPIFTTPSMGRNTHAKCRKSDIKRWGDSPLRASCQLWYSSAVVETGVQILPICRTLPQRLKKSALKLETDRNLSEQKNREKKMECYHSQGVNDYGLGELLRQADIGLCGERVSFIHCGNAADAIPEIVNYVWDVSNERMYLNGWASYQIKRLAEVLCNQDIAIALDYGDRIGILNKAKFIAALLRKRDNRRNQK